jgi:uncharacterized delta-60 repeat protein
MMTKRLVGNRVELLEDRRLLSAGTLDTSFGSTGLVKVGGMVSEAVAVYGNQTIVVGFKINGSGGTDAAVARLNFDGSPDTTFGPNHNGIVTFHDGDADHNTDLNAVVIGPNGTIIAGGSDNDGSSGVGAGNFMVACLRADGTFNSSFAGGGLRTLDFGLGSDDSAIRAMTMQSDGKIILVGSEMTDFGTREMAMMRLNANGTRDNSFNGDGTKTIDFDQDAFGTAVAIDYSGTAKTNKHFGAITVVGIEQDFDDSFEDFAVLRVTPGGTLDSSFHAQGQFVFRPAHINGAEATGVVIQSNGEAVISGTIGSFSDNGLASNSIFGVVRLTSGGLIDTHFGDAGNGWEEFSFGGKDVAASLLRGPNDRLIVGGSAGNKMAIASLTSNGLLDNAFGTGGRITASFSGAAASANGLAYMGDRIVASGGGSFCTARILDSEPDVTVAAFITNASEQGQTPVTFIVTRSEILPYDTQVSFTIGGTATPPTLAALRLHTADYTLSGMTIPFIAQLGHPLAPPSVDIPAGQSFALVTLTPIDDAIAEGTETAKFTINSNLLYNVVPPINTTINILDNDSKTFVPTADAFVQDGSNANKNFGSANQLQVRRSTTTGDRHQAFLKFDLSTLSNVNSVKLELYGNLSDSSQSNIGMSVFSSDTSWSESTIDFNKMPNTGGAVLATQTITDTTPRLYVFDVTAYVKSQLAQGHKVVAFNVRGAVGSNVSFNFNSRESAFNQPQLVVT